MLEEVWEWCAHRAQSFFEAGLGAILGSLPFWHHVITQGSALLQFITSLTGAFIGLHGAWRIVRRYTPGAERRRRRS